MKLIYTPKAREDLRDIKHYITDTLQNKIAAENISKMILKDCSLLKDNPLLGVDLSGKIDKQTDLRFLIIKNYIAFYKVENDVIKIIRIRNTRTNYMNIIFNDK